MDVDDCYMFDFDGSTNHPENVSETFMYVVSRSKDVATAEAMGLSMMNKLNNLTNIDLGDINVILIKKIGKHVMTNGRDKQGRHYFRARFRLLLDDSIR